MTSPAPGPAPPPLPSRHRPPGRSHRRGCLIALVVAAGLTVPLLGILAAIAIPAYQDYLARSRVAQSLAAAAALQPAVVAFVEAQGRCPVNGDPGFEPDEAYAGAGLAAIAFGESDAQVCAIELLLQDDRHEEVDGHRLWLEYDVAGGDWHCSAEVEARYLPANCRG